ncbi:MAG: RNase adapter RapZ, partial [Candidatus Nanopelagicales bacterium]|nr:RNase adapter RapZ [Candidatus Nanopelagicales bacterium]
MSQTRQLEVALVTGLSGAGRSTAARALEDLGWFVMDNLPPVLLSQAIELASRDNGVDRIGAVVDVRSGQMFNALEAALSELRERGVSLRILYLEASEESLVRRFESSRRPHPLQSKRRIVDGLREERALLGDLRATADVVVDTTLLNVHDVRRKVEAAFA